MSITIPNVYHHDGSEFALVETFVTACGNIQLTPDQYTISSTTSEGHVCLTVKASDMLFEQSQGYAVYHNSDTHSTAITSWKIQDGVVNYTNERITNLTENIEVGLEHPVCLLGLNRDQAIPAKIDTGADLCALHATNIEVQGGNVSFVFNGNKYTMKIVDHVTIARAGDEQKRPCVAFTTKIQDKHYPQIKYTLTDRSGLDCPILIGKNLLVPANITIDPSINESVLPPRLTIDQIKELFADEQA